MSIRVHLVVLILIGAVMGIALGSYQRLKGNQRNTLERSLGQAAIAQARLSVAEDTLRTFITTCDLFLAAQQPVLQPDLHQGHEASTRALTILDENAFTPQQGTAIAKIKQDLEAFRFLLDEPVFNDPAQAPTTSAGGDIPGGSVIKDVTFEDPASETTPKPRSRILQQYEALTERTVKGFESLRERMNKDYSALEASTLQAEKSQFRSFALSIGLLVIASIALLKWAQKQISLPIAAIARNAEKATREQHTYEGFDGGSREIQQLNQTLTKLINSLEDLVRSRTKELSEKTESLTEEVTRRAAAERDLLTAIDAAETASKAKSAFLAMMSHEIRTPMNGIVGFTDLLLDTKLSQNQREYGETVKSSAQNLLHILNDILDFSKIESGKLDFESVSFSFTQIVEESKSLITNAADKKGIEVLLSISDKLPDQFTGDPTRVRQILLNLMSNAVKFTSEGVVAITVDGEPIQPGPSGRSKWKVHCSVSDTGVGMSHELKAQLFNPFSQGDTSITRRFGGTGLGLAICKRLVEMMDGEIKVESAPGQGSEFRFHVQLEEALPEAVPSTNTP